MSSTSKSTTEPTGQRLTIPPFDYPTARSATVPDDTKIYRDGSGRTYRVSHEDHSRLLSKDSALKIKQTKLNSEQTRLEKLSNEVTWDRNRVDRTSQHSVDAFNRKVNQLNGLNSQVQSMVDDYNQDVQDFNTELERVGTPIN